MPATISFIVMVIISLYYSVVLCRVLYKFCSAFRTHVNRDDFPCGLLMNRFAMNHSTVASPATNYALPQTFSWITLVLWLMALAIMVARCVFVVDFELMQVVIYEVSDRSSERIQTRESLSDQKENSFFSVDSSSIIEYTSVENTEEMNLRNESDQSVSMLHFFFIFYIH